MASVGDMDSDGDTNRQKESSPISCEGDSSRVSYVLALDVGTTVMRAHIYDSGGHIRGASSVKVCKIQQRGGRGGGDCNGQREGAKKGRARQTDG